MSSITATTEWAALVAMSEQVRQIHLVKLFGEDPGRAGRMTIQAGDLVLDYSKHLVTEQVLDGLVALANAVGVPGRVQAMLAGERVNVTEGRSVLHTALRAPKGTKVFVDGHDVVPDVHAVLERMGAFADRVRVGGWVGYTGQPIRTVVNIGIGGSDLGPAMAYRALAPFVQPGLECRFVSNVDGADLDRTLTGLDPATTLFVVASKTFTTIETLTNARSAKEWLLAGFGGAGQEAVARHFVAVSTNAAAVAEFGIDTSNMFGFWDWVGGRYSVDSAIGLSLMIAIGPKAFTEFLDGFRTIDVHLRDAPPRANAPWLMALIGIWYRNFMGFASHAVLPYSHDLARFPAYLQQLDMESNGKRVTVGSLPVDYETGPIIWGEPGTNGQHAFYQLLHQGTAIVPVDFIGFLRPIVSLPGTTATIHHDQLYANMVAQSAALAFGTHPDDPPPKDTPEWLVPHRFFPGNRPSTTILADQLTPSVLGQLIALYEHKVAVQGFVWGVNSFDQWGVELGKVMAKRVADELVRPDPSPATGHGLDSSTVSLVALYRAANGR